MISSGFPTVDISQYEFEEFCDEFAFFFYERANGGSGDLYEYVWDEFCNRITDWDMKQPWIYRHKTNLGTLIHFKWEDGGYTMKVKQESIC